MTITKFKYSQSVTDLYTESSFSQLSKLAPRKSSILVTDENIYAAHSSLFKGWNVIILHPGEDYKVQQTVDAVIEELISMEADRSTTIVGIGGGVVTDLTGFAASIYMRGVRFGFVPTTVLASVDASIGGKNGIDVGVYKNMAGCFRQPSFILQDQKLLSTLPRKEWINGFAEIIKHASIKDADMFKDLQKHDIDYYINNQKASAALIRKNALLKSAVVKRDEFEKNERRQLNFGHTLGHALENQYDLMHGEAISIGMAFAADVSAEQLGFAQPEEVKKLLQQYELPVRAAFDPDKVMQVLKMDKKKTGAAINYVLLDRIGKAVVRPIPVSKIATMLRRAVL